MDRSTTSQPSAETEPEFISESQSQAKRSVKSEQSKQANQPILLNPKLIDKLMANKTLVSLMSGQLKRVISTDKMDDLEKHRIVRQVFDQMMEEKVDFSMNNVRLAVKTVSSSYRAAAEKQRQRSLINPANNEQINKTSNAGKKQKSKTESRNGFGRRSSSSSPSSDEQPARDGSQMSKSFPAIDTALKLTKKDSKSASRSDNQQSSSTSSTDATKSESVNSKKTDSSGNPIVVVLLPQEKKARR